MMLITLRSKYKTVHDLSHADLYHHRAPALLQPHGILLLAFPRLPLGLYMSSRGKHLFIPHTFAWLTSSQLFKWMSLLPRRRPDCHALPHCHRPLCLLPLIPALKLLIYSLASLLPCKPSSTATVTCFPFGHSVSITW